MYSVQCSNWRPKHSQLKRRPLFVWRVHVNMTTTLDDVNGCVAMLQYVAEYCDNYERKKKLLVSKALETFGVLKEVWPKQIGTKPSLPSSLSCLLANEYYLDSKPIMTMQSSDTKHGMRILFLAESHGETPLPVLGKKIVWDRFVNQCKQSFWKCYHLMNATVILT